MFFAAVPETKRESWCKGCYERTTQLGGILFDGYDVYPAWRCSQCGTDLYADGDGLLREVHEKLDRLLSHLGLGRG